jgi:hypothetical protein
MDNSRQTGGEGGQDCKLTEVDNLVLLIVGKESPAVQGLNVKESCVKEPTSLPTVKDNGSDILIWAANLQRSVGQEGFSPFSQIC